MDKLTLDTNALRSWAWSAGHIEDSSRNRLPPGSRNELLHKFQRLSVLRDNGLCELGVPNQFETDLAADPDGPIAVGLRTIVGSLVRITTPSLTTFPIVFPAVYWDQSRFDEIFSSVFPDSLPEHSKFERNQRDALLIYAHFTSGRDYFLTEDGPIARAAMNAREKFGIEILTVAEYLDSRA